MTNNKELGLQPLNDVMTKLHLTNASLVRASTRQLSHKMVQKGRKGRRLTPHIQTKIQEALNVVSADHKFTLKELFNY